MSFFDKGNSDEGDLDVVHNLDTLPSDKGFLSALDDLLSTNNDDQSSWNYSVRENIFPSDSDTHHQPLDLFDPTALDGVQSTLPLDSFLPDLSNINQPITTETSTSETTCTTTSTIATTSSASSSSHAPLNINADNTFPSPLQHSVVLDTNSTTTAINSSRQNSSDNLSNIQKGSDRRSSSVETKSSSSARECTQQPIPSPQLEALNYFIPSPSPSPSSPIDQLFTQQSLNASPANMATFSSQSLRYPVLPPQLSQVHSLSQTQSLQTNQMAENRYSSSPSLTGNRCLLPRAEDMRNFPSVVSENYRSNQSLSNSLEQEDMVDRGDGDAQEQLQTPVEGSGSEGEQGRESEEGKMGERGAIEVEGDVDDDVDSDGGVMDCSQVTDYSSSGRHFASAQSELGVGVSKPPTTAKITLDDLKEVFDLERPKAEKRLNLKRTTFSNLSRHFGISKWPYRTIRDVRNRQQANEAILRDGNISKEKRRKLLEQQRNLEDVIRLIYTDPTESRDSNTLAVLLKIVESKRKGGTFG